MDQKLSVLTLDNCSTNDALVSFVLGKLSNNTLWLDGVFLHMRCCAQTLNLIVKDGLEIISEAIEKVRENVAFWSVTPKRSENFEEIARQVKVSCTKKVDFYCKTRWNFTYFMLNVAICYKDIFKCLKQRTSLQMSSIG